MSYKEYRNLKVYGQAGYRLRETPTITLKGEWLRELGFETDTPITVRCEEGRLTITAVEVSETAGESVVPAASPRLGQVAERGMAYGKRR